MALTDTALELEMTIRQYHIGLTEQYPKASFIPKMLFMCHLRQHILGFGPLKHQWCMCFEAKNSFFTPLKWKNFKNIAKSLALKHQRHMCHEMLSSTNSPSTNFLYDGDIVKEGEVVTRVSLPGHQQESVRTRIPQSQNVYHTDSTTMGSVGKPLKTMEDRKAERDKKAPSSIVTSSSIPKVDTTPDAPKELTKSNDQNRRGKKIQELNQNSNSQRINQIEELSQNRCGKKNQPN